MAKQSAPNYDNVIATSAWIAVEDDEVDKGKPVSLPSQSRLPSAAESFCLWWPIDLRQLADGYGWRVSGFLAGNPFWALCRSAM